MVNCFVFPNYRSFIINEDGVEKEVGYIYFSDDTIVITYLDKTWKIIDKKLFDSIKVKQICACGCKLNSYFEETFYGRCLKHTPFYDFPNTKDEWDKAEKIQKIYIDIVKNKWGETLKNLREANKERIKQGE